MNNSANRYGTDTIRTTHIIAKDIIAEKITATNFYGNLTGDVTGDVVGDLIGDVKAADGTIVLNNGTDGTDATFAGNVTGNLTGDVTGNLTGDVTGNLTGNATGITTGGIPTSSADIGTTGNISYNDLFIYICVNTNTWRRVAISDW